MHSREKAGTKKIVKVTWLDSGHEESNMDEECIKELYPVRLVSFGLLMVNDAERVIISSHVLTTVTESDETHIDYKDTLCIPRKSVLSVDVLGEQEIE